jgi:hypothetical protein
MEKSETDLHKNLKSFQLKLITRLFAARKKESWPGELSSSALSTAVGIFALSEYDQDRFILEINSGLNWLIRNINKDGSYGDTSSSPGNISTTLLCWAAFKVSARVGRNHSEVIGRVEAYLSQEAGSLKADDIFKKILDFYGDDHTFSVPILSMCALAGCFGEDTKVWKRIPQLPFELSVLPPGLFKSLKLDVVSYALPALITIGLLRFQKVNHWWNPLNLLRRLVKKKALKKLVAIQPENGGFLEASPLTGFVLMSLVGSGNKGCSAAEKCAVFLQKSQRINGSLPIDTHLHTWVTTLVINALTEDVDSTWLDKYSRRDLRKFLLDQQHQQVHPYTNADAGGWSWSPLAGAVPDADDTAGALVALRRLSTKYDLPVTEAASGVRWLMDLQNKDGGLPTFCKGWGKLPFDKSCPDITAHVIRAFIEWKRDLPEMACEIEERIDRMLKYLAQEQKENGAWQPLWFGNQYTKDQRNLTYGTAQVVIALNDCGACDFNFEDLLTQGEHWLLSAQNSDGSWGGDKGCRGSIEETALAVNALISAGKYHEQVDKGMQALLDLTKNGSDFTASPIGLYFASLWYDEKMYPLVFTMAAVEKYLLKQDAI